MTKRPTIAITSGEPAGIGPELIAFINSANFAARLVIIGDENLLQARASKISKPLTFTPYQQNREPEAGNLEIIHIPFLYII